MIKVVEIKENINETKKKTFHMEFQALSKAASHKKKISSRLLCVDDDKAAAAPAVMKRLSVRLRY